MDHQQTTEHIGEAIRHFTSDGSKEELLRGFFRVLLLYDVAEALDLAKIREIAGPRGGSIERGFPRRTPEYVRFEQPPIIESAGPITIHATGENVKETSFYPPLANLLNHIGAALKEMVRRKAASR